MKNFNVLIVLILLLSSCGIKKVATKEKVQFYNSSIQQKVAKVATNAASIATSNESIEVTEIGFYDTSKHDSVENGGRKIVTPSQVVKYIKTTKILKRKKQKDSVTINDEATSFKIDTMRCQKMGSSVTTHTSFNLKYVAIAVFLAALLLLGIKLIK